MEGRGMGLYTYFFLNRDGSIPMFDTAEAASAGEALDWGARLLRLAPEREAVEVWRDDHRLTTVTRLDSRSA
jgi:hypothetical protein